MEKKGTLVILDFKPMFKGHENPIFEKQTNDYTLAIYLDDKITLEKALKDRKSFDAYFETDLEILDANGNEESAERLVKEWRYFGANFDNLLDVIDKVQIALEGVDPRDYLKKHPELKDKKIILNEEISILEPNRLKEIEKEYSDLKDRIYVYLDGNNIPVSIDDCYKTIEIIKNTATSIKNLNLSPFETIMYTYDFVRNRVYKSEDDNKADSRDLTSILLGDKIVCVGYANLFQALLLFMGFEKIKTTKLTSIFDDEAGHVRNEMYVQDKKHNIDGIYYFDTTWDSKRNENDKSYLSSYRFFAKTSLEIKKITEGNFLKNKFEPIDSTELKTIKRILREPDGYKNLMVLGYSMRIRYWSTILFGDPMEELHDINYMKNITDEQIDELLEKIEKITYYSDNEIPAETMIEVFKNVRKVEYYQDPEYFPYDVESILNAIINSEWNFESTDGLDKATTFFYNLGLKDPKTRRLLAQEYLKKNISNIYKELNGVKLTRVLRNNLEIKKHKM